MTTITLTPETYLTLKQAAHTLAPALRSGHLDEVLAAGLGHRTYASLKAALWAGSTTATIDNAAATARACALGADQPSQTIAVNVAAQIAGLIAPGADGLDAASLSGITAEARGDLKRAGFIQLFFSHYNRRTGAWEAGLAGPKRTGDRSIDRSWVFFEVEAQTRKEAEAKVRAYVASPQAKYTGMWVTLVRGVAYVGPGRILVGNCTDLA